jgi:hypothetical protein
MITLPQAHSAIEVYFQDNWLIADAPVQYDNASDKFTEPTDGPWAHFQVIFGDTRRASTCNTAITYRQSGVAQLYIYVPRGQGAGVSYALAEKQREIFVNNLISDIEFAEGFISPPEPKANWFHNRVSIPFSYTTQSTGRN